MVSSQLVVKLLLVFLWLSSQGRFRMNAADLQQQLDDLKIQLDAMVQQRDAAAAQAAAAPPLRLVYAPRKLSEFGGTPDQCVEAWVTLANDTLKVHNLKGKAAADFLRSHVRGAASVELSYADDADRDDLDKILEILKGAFGESRSADELLEILSTRKQKEKESLMEYSRVLMGLLKRAKKRMRTWYKIPKNC